MIITHVQRISLWFVVLLAFANAHEPKSSSSEDVFGEYCFAKELQKDGVAWKLKKYKENKPYLFSYIPCSYEGKYSLSVSSFGFVNMFSNSSYDKIKPSRCSKENFSRDFFSIDEFKSQSEKEMSENLDLKGYHNLDWEITYDSNYVRLHHSGSTKVYISGFCTEEQLKIIRKRKKANGN